MGLKISIKALEHLRKAAGVVIPCNENQ